MNSIKMCQICFSYSHPTQLHKADHNANDAGDPEAHLQTLESTGIVLPQSRPSNLYQQRGLAQSCAVGGLGWTNIVAATDVADALAALAFLFLALLVLRSAPPAFGRERETFEEAPRTSVRCSSSCFLSCSTHRKAQSLGHSRIRTAHAPLG